MKEDGVIIVSGPDGTTETSTMQCAHCGKHFTVKRGSGTVRGFCQPCNRVTCGSNDCLAHFPFEKKLDLVEKGKFPLIIL